MSATSEFNKEPLGQIEHPKMPRKIEAGRYDAEATSVSLVNAPVVADMNHLDEQIRSMMDETENFVTRPSGIKMKAFICKICGKELVFSDMTRHIESNHITGVTHSCNICGKTSRSRKALWMHVHKEHRK